MNKDSKNLINKILRVIKNDSQKQDNQNIYINNVIVIVESEKE